MAYKNLYILDLAGSIFLFFVLVICWIQGLLWVALPLPIFLYYYSIYLRLSLLSSEEKGRQDFPQNEKVLVKTVISPFLVFFVAPTFLLYFLAALPLSESYKLITSLRLEASVHYEGFYNGISLPPFLSLLVGAGLPEVLKELKNFGGPIISVFKINFLAVYLFCVSLAFGAFATGCALLLNAKWLKMPRSFWVKISNYSILTTTVAFIFFSILFFCMMAYLIFPSRFDFFAMSYRLLILNMYAFIAPVCYAAALSSYAHLKK